MEPQRSYTHIPWSVSTNIYEVNVRQFTPEGTFTAFEAHLPRLKSLGVGILWFMPLHPIGMKNRKGELGSYYAVSSYTKINPEFGTMEDFVSLVQECHRLEMKVIIDWVANHTAWDNDWVLEHPDWYQKDENGQIHAYKNWSDVIGLDYTNRDSGLWEAMADAMAFWVKEADVDGFRCDYARTFLDDIKPMFMLAEGCSPDLHKAFDMTYDRNLYTILRRVKRDKGLKARELKKWWRDRQKKFSPDDYHLMFTSNHDENSWYAADADCYGEAFQAMAVLAALLPGTPLIYGGQESLFSKKIKFFEKDEIDFGDYSLQDFYANLLGLKRKHPALWNGKNGGNLEWINVETQTATNVIGFRRTKGDCCVTVYVNIRSTPFNNGVLDLPAWGWKIEANCCER